VGVTGSSTLRHVVGLVVVEFDAVALRVGQALTYSVLSGKVSVNTL